MPKVTDIIAKTLVIRGRFKNNTQTYITSGTIKQKSGTIILDNTGSILSMELIQPLAPQDNGNVITISKTSDDNHTIETNNGTVYTVSNKSIQFVATNGLWNLINDDGNNGGGGGNDCITYITEKADFPEPNQDDVIVLAENTTYSLCGFINLGTSTIELSSGSYITSVNMNTSVLFTLSNTQPAIYAQNIGQVLLREFSIASPNTNAIHFIENTLNSHINLFYVAFLGCASVGIINGFTVQTINSCFVGSFDVTRPGSGFTFTGTTNKTFLNANAMENFNLGDAFTFDANYVCDHIDITTNYVKLPVAPANTVHFINFIANETQQPKEFALISDNMLFGSITPLTGGVTTSTVGWSFLNNSGIPNSEIIGIFNMDNTAGIMATTIPTQNDPVVLNASTVLAPISQRFEQIAGNHLRYIGKRGAFTTLIGSIVIDRQGSSNTYAFYIGSETAVFPETKMLIRPSTGNDIRNVTTSSVREISQNDEFRLWISNETSGSTTINLHSCNLTIRR